MYTRFFQLYLSAALVLLLAMGGCWLISDSGSGSSSDASASPFDGSVPAGDGVAPSSDGGSGSTVWATPMGEPGLTDTPVALLATADGGALMAAWTTGDGAGIGGRLFKLDASGAVSWQVKLDDQWIYDAALTSDGGVVVGGEGEKGSGASAGKRPAWIAKYDAAGAQVWARDLDVGTTPAKIYAVAVAPDGGLLFGGHRASPDNAFYSMAFVVRTDADGLDCGSPDCWQQNYDSQFYTGDWDTVLDLLVLDNDDGILVGGQSGDQLTKAGAWLKRLRFTGDEIWHKDLPASSGQGVFRINSMVELADGYVAAGNAPADNAPPDTLDADAWIVKVDKTSGTVISNKKISASGNYIEMVQALIRPASGSGFILAGHKLSFPPTGWLARFEDDASTVVWEQMHGPDDNLLQLFAVTALGGGYLVAGTISETPGDPLSMGDIMLLQVSPDGSCPGCF